MRRDQYADPGANSRAASQMSQYRMQALSAEEENQYMAAKAEAQWQWERDGAAKGSSLMQSHLYKEGQGEDASRSAFQGQRSDSKSSLEKLGSRGSRDVTRQDEMEMSFDDNTLPPTLEGLEQKFLQDIMKLTKEQEDAEDKENARHRERLNEINTQYQEKLLAVRARQAAHREEFLRKESQARHQQYQQANMNSYQNSAGPSDAHGYGSAAGAMADAHRAYATGRYDNYGEQPEYTRGPRGRGFETRGQYPDGRAYNSGGRYY